MVYLHARSRRASKYMILLSSDRLAVSNRSNLCGIVQSGHEELVIHGWAWTLVSPHCWDIEGPGVHMQ
jgi:hypothetical protein